jgi:flagellar protein FliS
MFASHFTSRPQARSALSGLYQQVGVETRVDSATPHQLVALLFDGFLEAVAQARGAMQAGNHEMKGRYIGRAVRIIDEGLRPGLDLRAGGKLAADLMELYAYVTMRLTVANLRNDESALAECHSLVTPLREAWNSIGGQSTQR